MLVPLERLHHFAVCSEAEQLTNLRRELAKQEQFIIYLLSQSEVSAYLLSCVTISLPLLSIRVMAFLCSKNHIFFTFLKMHGDRVIVQIAIFPESGFEHFGKSGSEYQPNFRILTYYNRIITIVL